MKEVQFCVVPNRAEFECHRGVCCKLADSLAMDAKGNRFFVSPMEFVKVRSHKRAA